MSAQLILKLSELDQQNEMRPKQTKNIKQQPLHTQISASIRQSILTGRLKPGQTVMSTRELAKQLEVSRFTVRRAYEDLISQGYLQTNRGGNCCVAQRLPGDVSSMREADGTVHSIEMQLTPFGNSLAQHDSKELKGEFSGPGFDYSKPSLDQLPLSAWRQLLAQNCRFERPESIEQETAHPFGIDALRQAVASYLNRARAHSCSLDQVAIFSGSYPLDLIVRLLADRGDTVVCEDPSYSGARRIFKSHGLNISTLPVDDQGMQTNLLKKLSPPPVLIYVTPSHQEPTGSIMSLERRRALIEYARDTNAIIVEDDYEGEFVNRGNLLPAIAASDSESVIYLQSFWKIFGNLTKLNFIVLPKRLCGVFLRAKKLLDKGLPLIEQRALAAFLDQGYFERNIKRLRNVYDRKREILIESVSFNLTGCLSRQPSVSAMHILIQFHSEIGAQSIEQASLQSGFPVVSTAGYYEGKPQAGEYLIPFAQLEEEALIAGCERFAQCLWRLVL